MHELFNLLVDLRSERFGEEALSASLRDAQTAGAELRRGAKSDEAFLAWIDDEFGGAWSTEAAAGKNVTAVCDGARAGFATYDARGLQFAWLRGLAAEPDVGVFGPFGVARAFRGTPLGPALLRVALCELRAVGYARALIPAVGDERLVRYYAKHTGAEIAERFDLRQMPRYRTVVLASGSGTNFQSVVDGAAEGKLPLDLVLLLSNKPQAYALERARRANIAAAALPWDRKSEPRDRYDRGLLEMVRREEPQLLLLLGWMHLLDERFLSEFPHVINIHPAFLPLDQLLDHVTFPDGSVTPAFRGAHAVHDALAFGSAWVGASSHRVTLDTDRGPVLVRRPLRVWPDQGLEGLMERLHPAEHEVLASGIRRWALEQ